jgi:hypothetical protein
MSTVITLTCLEQQHAELLPARTVLSMFATQGTDLGSGDGLGPALVKMLGITGGGHSTPGSAGSDGQPQQSD